MAAVNHAYERFVAERSPESSFTVDVLAVDAFHAVSVAVAESGEVLSADEPYGLEAFLTEPARCFCTIELVPEAGGTIVTVTVEAADDDTAAPSASEVVGVLARSLTT